jgi:hypothetical protein
MALDFAQSVEVDFLAQWKSLVPAGVNHLPGPPDIVDQFCVGFFHLNNPSQLSVVSPSSREPN